MNRRQNAHRRKTIDRIMEVMRVNPGVWMSSNEVATKMKISQSRTVGKHLKFLCSCVAGLEICIDTHTRHQLFRYNYPEELQDGSAERDTAMEDHTNE